MKKAVLRVAICAAFVAAGAGSANAATWPANCRTWTCVNGHLTRLHRVQVAQGVKLANLSRTLGGVLGCLAEGPITSYGDPSGTFGYAFDNNDGLGPFLTSGIDWTTSGDPVDGWALFDICNGSTTARSGHGPSSGKFPQLTRPASGQRKP